MATWQIDAVCGMDEIVAALKPDVEGCPDVSADGTGLGFSGPVTYSADGTYSVMMTLQGTMLINMPGSCLTNADTGVKATCEQLTMALAAKVKDDPNTPFTKASCTGSDSCVCDMELAPTVIGDTGTYVIAGGTMTTTDSDNKAEKDEFCVKGSTMTLTLPARTVGAELVSPVLTLKK